jgi:hypothetical protein
MLPRKVSLSLNQLAGKVKLGNALKTADHA